MSSRFRIFGVFDRGPGEATVTISRDGRGTMEIRPLRSRTVYKSTLASLCAIAVAKECKMMALERRKSKAK